MEIAKIATDIEKEKINTEFFKPILTISSQHYQFNPQENPQQTWKSGSKEIKYGVHYKTDPLNIKIDYVSNTPIRFQVTNATYINNESTSDCIYYNDPKFEVNSKPSKVVIDSGNIILPIQLKSTFQFNPHYAEYYDQRLEFSIDDVFPPGHEVFIRNDTKGDITKYTLILKSQDENKNSTTFFSTNLMTHPEWVFHSIGEILLDIEVKDEAKAMVYTTSTSTPIILALDHSLNWELNQCSLKKIEGNYSEE